MIVQLLVETVRVLLIGNLTYAISLAINAQQPTIICAVAVKQITLSAATTIVCLIIILTTISTIPI